MRKKYSLLLILLLLTLTLIGCGKEKQPTKNDDPINPIVDPGTDPEIPGSNLTCAEDSTQEKCKDPNTWDWNYNRFSFNGKNMQVLILHGYPAEIDPYNENYSGGRAEEKRIQLKEIEEAYGVDIVFDKYPDCASWGPARISWINDLANKKSQTEGDIFAIASDWIPSLVSGNSIAELASFSQLNEQTGGIFEKIGYQQSTVENENVNYNGKIYGYSVDNVHADYFLYYNQDLVDQYNLEDPATLWNEGKWDWKTFDEYLAEAQEAFDNSLEVDENKIYAFGGNLEEVIVGMLSASGECFVDLEHKKINFTNPVTIDLCKNLRSVKRNYGWAPSSTYADVSFEFASGRQLFAHGALWFLSSDMRFKTDSINFEISAVPYPTRTGDGLAREYYKMPLQASECYAFRNIENGVNGLTTEVLVNIMDDLIRGIKPEINYDEKSKSDRYILTLPITKKEVPIFIGDFVLGSYGTGAVMAVPAHDERDYQFAKKFNMPIKEVVKSVDDSEIELPYTQYGILHNSGEFDGLTSKEAKNKIVEKLSSKNQGKKTINYRLKDWLISRQRYWGAPIPIVYCDECGTVPVPEKDLPVLLPYDVEFKPDGESPLKKSKEFMNCTCPKCGGKATREADTLDTFVCSSWYELRYPDSKNEEKAFDKDIINKLAPVDVYVGGKEHAAMHLIYARFMTKALRDLGYLNFDEPFTKLIHQGMILGPDGNKMSKSKGNTVSPEEYIEKYGSDIFRMYIMFGFDYRQGGPWNEKGIDSMVKYFSRIERLIESIKELEEKGTKKNIDVKEIHPLNISIISYPV